MLRDGGHSAVKTRVRAVGRLLSMRVITIARAEPRAKPELRLFPVFVLFRPVFGGQIGRPHATPAARISRLHPAAYGTRETPGCARPPVFLLLFTGTNRRRGRRLRTLPMPQCITTSRVSAGARSRD